MITSLVTVVSIAAGFAFLTPAPAYADGPEVTLSKSGPTTVLDGDRASYTLSATNPIQSGAVPGYNVSFRDELPAGVTYEPGSSSPASAGEPMIFVDPVDGHQTLIWDNIFDLQVGQTETIGFDIQIDQNAHPVGSVFSNTGDVYANTNPRTVPRFDGNGDPISGYTQAATSSPVTTSVSALEITKTEPSPEAELLRGVHNHPTIYTLTVRNSATAPTDGVTVVDHLPAGLEFLGCGDVDNSADVEYPGAPTLDAIPDVPGNCPTPVSVSTALDPPGKAAGVYTRVEWELGTLPAGAEEIIQYAAGIPQRLNTMTFPDGAPSPESLGQSANLDNNSGASTREMGAEAEYQNYVDTAGIYTGDVAPGTDPEVSAAAVNVVTAEDVALQKSVDPGSFDGGGVATYTLQIQVSEYADASDIVLTDRLPSGLCPLSTTQNHAPNGPADCDPGPGFGATGASFDSVVANSDGSYDIAFTPLASTANGTITVTYKARMRSIYRSNGLPTVSGDDFTNSVQLTGTTVPNPDITTPTAATSPWAMTPRRRW